MRIEWDIHSDVNEACRKTKGFVVCNKDYDIQKVFNHGLFHEESLAWWNEVGHMALICPVKQKETDKYVNVFLVESAPGAVKELPGVKVERFYFRNLEKVNPKFAQVVKVAVVLSRTLNGSDGRIYMAADFSSKPSQTAFSAWDGKRRVL